MEHGNVEERRHRAPAAGRNSGGCATWQCADHAVGLHPDDEGAAGRIEQAEGERLGKSALGRRGQAVLLDWLAQQGSTHQCVVCLCWLAARQRQWHRVSYKFICYSDKRHVYFLAFTFHRFTFLTSPLWRTPMLLRSFHSRLGSRKHDLGNGSLAASVTDLSSSSSSRPLRSM